MTTGSSVAPAKSSGRRLSVVTVDQGLSSLSNVAAIIWVAHALTPADFGRFSLIMMGYMVAQVAVRGLVSTTVLVHPEDADQRPGEVLSSTVVLGLAAGALCVAASLALLGVGSELGGPLLALGVLLPLLLVHDVGRYVGIARQQPGSAVVLDVLWIGLMAVGFAAATAFGLDTLTWLVIAWSGAGAVAGLWVFAQYGAPAGAGMTWVRERWDVSWRLMVSGLAASGTALLTASLMTLFSSPLAVAAFRAASLLAAPSTALQLAVGTAAAADIARERDQDHAVRMHVRRAIAISTAVGVLNLVVLVFLPDVLGHAVLGEAWDVVEPLMLAVGLKVLLMAAQSGLRAAMIGRHQIQAAMVTDIVSIVLVGACMVVGAAIGDAEGALWGMAVATGVSTVCWWVAMWWVGRGPAAAGDRAPAEEGGDRAVQEPSDRP